LYKKAKERLDNALPAYLKILK